MKKLLLILFLFPLIGFGQKNFNQVLKQQNLSSISDSLQFQISYSNYCLNRYRVEKLIGIGAQLVGGGIVCYYNLPQTNGLNNAKEDFKIETAIAGESIAAQLVALRKFEKIEREIKKKQDNAIIAGGITFAAGSIISIISTRWLKKSFIVPAENGIGLQLNF
jgi:hypothetical protein